MENIVYRWFSLLNRLYWLRADCARRAGLELGLRVEKKHEQLEICGAPAARSAQTGGDMAKEVETIRADAQTVASVRLTVDRDELGSALDEVLPEIMEQLSREGVEATGPPFTRFHRSEGKSLEIEAGLPVGARVAGGGRVRASEPVS